MLLKQSVSHHGRYYNMAKTPWKSNAQLEEENQIKDLEPTPEEIRDSVLEIKMLTILVETGVLK